MQDKVKQRLQAADRHRQSGEEVKGQSRAAETETLLTERGTDGHTEGQVLGGSWPDACCSSSRATPPGATEDQPDSHRPQE